MLLDVNYLRMKRLILKNFKDFNVYIEVKGEFNTKYCIGKARVLINRHKIIISDENVDCTILLDFMEKIKINSESCIELRGKEAIYILEV